MNLTAQIQVWLRDIIKERKFFSKKGNFYVLEMFPAYHLPPSKDLCFLFKFKIFYCIGIISSFSIHRVFSSQC